MGKERRFFSKEENADYRRKLVGLCLGGLDYTTQLYLSMVNPEETVVFKMNELVTSRKLEAGKRRDISDIIDNG